MLSTKRCWLVLVLAFALPARAQTGSQASIEGMVWDPSGAVVAASSLPSWDRDRATERALVHAGQELVVRFFPPGDPRGGLPISSGAVAVFRRHLARIVGGFLRAGDLEIEPCDAPIAAFATPGQTDVGQVHLRNTGQRFEHGPKRRVAMLLPVGVRGAAGCQADGATRPAAEQPR